MSNNLQNKENFPKISFKRNVLFNIVSWFLPLIVAFIATPIIINQIGLKNYGLFSLILGFISYSFTFNVGRAVTKYTAEFRANNQNEKINDVILSGLFVNIFLGFLGFVLIVLMTNWLVVDIFLISEDLKETAKIGFYIAALTIFLTMIGQVFIAVLQGIHRFDLYSGIITIISLFLIVGNLVLVFFNYSIQSLLVWNLITVLFSTIAFFSFSQKYQKIGSLTLNFSILKSIVKYGLSVTAYQILGSLLLLFERTLITRMFGEESLTFYIVPMALGIYIHSFITSLTIAIFPITSQIKSSENKEKLLSIYMKSSKIVFALVTCLCVIFIAANKVILKLWIGGELGETFAEKSSDILVVQVITFGLLAIVIISWILVEGVKNAFFNSLQTLLWLLIGIPSMIWLAPIYSSFGIAVGRLIGVSIIPITILIAEKWVFGKPLWRFWSKNLIILSLVFVGSFYLEQFLLNSFSQTRFIFVLEAIFVGFSFFTSLFIVGFFNDEEKMWLRNIFKF